MTKFDYTRQDLEYALGKIGIGKGDRLFIHCNIGFFGRMEGAGSAEKLCDNFLFVLKKVLTDEGTFVLPTFSYSFCHGEIYDPKSTKSVCGMLTEYARKQEDVIRSLDPNFSIAAWGKLAREYTENPTHESFGEGSFWERLLNGGAKIVCMNMDCGSTFVHFAERYYSVPYRYNKAFNGVKVLSDGTRQRDHAVHYVFDGEEDAPSFERLDRKCRDEGICKTTDLGKGSMLVMDIRQYFDLICKTLKTEPRFLTAGG